MKKLLFIILIVVFYSCSDDDKGEPKANDINKVLLLQVDFSTNVLEGAKELTFSESTEDFSISSNYQAPGDIGNISLYYQEADEMIFDGSIIWMGLGEKTFPTNFMTPENLEILDDPLSIPSLDLFQNTIYDEFAYYPEPTDYNAIWDAINDLELVSEYRANNPNSEINVFLYTPSVGVGDPLEWDYFIFLKN